MQKKKKIKINKLYLLWVKRFKMLGSEVSSIIPAENTKTLSVLKLDNHLCQLSNCFLYLTEAAQLICTPCGCTKEVWFIFFSGCMTQWQPTQRAKFHSRWSLGQEITRNPSEAPEFRHISHVQYCLFTPRPS